MNNKKIPEKWYDVGFTEPYHFSDEDYSQLQSFLQKLSNNQITLSNEQKRDLQELANDYCADFHRNSKNISPPNKQFEIVSGALSKAKKLIDAIQSFDMLTVKSIAWANDVEAVDMADFLSNQVKNLEKTIGYAETTIQESKKYFQDSKALFGELYDGILKKKKGSLDKLIWCLADFFEQATGEKAKQPTRNDNKNLGPTGCDEDWNCDEYWKGPFYEFVVLFINTIKITEEDYLSRTRPENIDETPSRLAKIVKTVLEKRKLFSS